MEIVLELDRCLLDEAGQMSGIAEPSALVERALRQLIRVEAYRSYLAERDIVMTEAEIARTQHEPFYTIETYKPQKTGNHQAPQGSNETATVASNIPADDRPATGQESPWSAIIAMGGSDPEATAPPRRRFW